MLLERKGARVAFCVTQGFTDLLYLRRQNRASLYDLSVDYPPPLASHEMTVAVPERIEPQGITKSLTPDLARQVADQVVALNPDIVAVLLLLLFVLLRSRLGGSLQAIRDDEEAAASVGVRVLLGKGILFVVAGAGSAAAGTIILAWQLSILPLGPDSIFGVNWTAKMIFMVLVGGLGTFEGPIIGAVALYVLQTYGPNNGVWYFVLLGGIAIGFALVLPRGIWGTIQERFNVQLLPVGYRLRTVSNGKGTT